MKVFSGNGGPNLAAHVGVLVEYAGVDVCVCMCVRGGCAIVCARAHACAHVGGCHVRFLEDACMIPCAAHRSQAQSGLALA